MHGRTDLALESYEGCENQEGIKKTEKSFGSVKITNINVDTDTAAEKLGRPKGEYITIELAPLMNNSSDEDAHLAIKNELSKLIDTDGTVLVVGLGNTEITPDALGPKTASRVLATRHISKELASEIGLEGLNSVAVLSPGVLGQTGMETAEIIKGAVERINPTAVMTIDALAAKDLNRLGSTVQICNTGISPGSGVGNSRSEISQNTLGIPVIALGVPTVVDASTLVYELTGKENNKENSEMIVTPREIDMVIDRASELIGHAINCALHPNVNEDILRSCV